jgi:type VI secretion system secreted protein VgrG
MAITQKDRFLQITTPLGDDFLLLMDFHGEEGISKLFHFDLNLGHEEPTTEVKPTLLGFDSIVGKNVTVKIALADGGERFINGHIVSFGQGGRDGKFSYYRAAMVPWLWFLSRDSDCRIFQNMTVPEIVKQVFDQLGFKDHRDALSRTYTKWDYCTQYHETHLNFVSRLMEEEGIFYYFEHEDGKHTLVLADSPSAFQDVGGTSTVPFVTEMDDPFGQTVTAWQIEQEARPGKYTLRDHHFEVPTKNLESSEPTIAALSINKPHEMYDYPGNFAKRFNKTNERLGNIEPEGRTVVGLRMEEEEAPGAINHGGSNCPNFVPGAAFTLKNHPANVNGRYVFTLVRHSAVQTPAYVTGAISGVAYNNSFVCIDHQVRYRPARLSPKPAVQGPQTAVVVGKSGEEIWTDTYGRVKVQFFWDRLGKMDENSSCWVRVAQVWAGEKWGAMHIPRIGQEVIVDFLYGDPDQPIIVGRVYNADQKPPYDLPDNQTQSGIKSRSTKGGDSATYNEIRFEDKKGSEHFLIHAERLKMETVEADSVETVGHDRFLTVENDQKEWIKGLKHLHVVKDHKEKIEGAMNVHVLGDQNQKVEGDQSNHVVNNLNEKVDQSASLDIGMNLAEKVGMNQSMDVGMNLYLKAGMNLVLEAGMAITLKAAGGFITIGPGGIFISGQPLVMINSGGAAVPGTAGSLTAPKDPVDPDDPGKSDDPYKGK